MAVEVHSLLDRDTLVRIARPDDTGDRSEAKWHFAEPINCYRVGQAPVVEETTWEDVDESEICDQCRNAREAIIRFMR